MLIQRTYGYTGAKENTRVYSNADETRFVALNPSKDAAYWVKWTLNAPIEETYIMIPACAYDGNRFEAVERKYPPMYTEDEMGLNPPIRMTQVPRLAKEGDSFMDVTTGDMAAPCVCILNKVNKQGFMLFFEQGTHSLNHGVTLEQEGDKLHIFLRAPAKRRLVYRWSEGGIPSLQSIPDADTPLSVKKGTETILVHRAVTFPCADIPSLYRIFFSMRAMLYHAAPHASLPFSAFWDISEEQLNTSHFDEEEGHYRLDTMEASQTNKYTQWQAGWVGGGMNTLTSIVDGNSRSRENAIKTLQYAARQQSAAGFYYGIVFNGEVKHDCFGKYEEKYNLQLIRKQADMVYFMFKQILSLQKLRLGIPGSIVDSAIRGANALVTLWEKYGQMGQFVNAETGEIVVGGSTAGALAPAALCAAYEITRKPRYLEYARQIARYFYRTATMQGVTCGGPGEILQAPDSESAAALLESFTVLYELDQTKDWLNMACDAAHQLASWVVPYDYAFPQDSRLERRGVFAAGSVWANVQNKHSAPGICTLSAASFLKLYRATGNENYLRIMREISHFLTQVTSTDEMPLFTVKGKRMAPGAMCERVNMSDWEGTQNVGDSIFGSSSWPETAAMLTWTEIPGVYAMPARGVVCASDHVNAWINGDTLTIENPTVYPARVKVMIEHEEEHTSPLGLYWQERMRIVRIPAGAKTKISL